MKSPFCVAPRRSLLLPEALLVLIGELELVAPLLSMRLDIGPVGCTANVIYIHIYILYVYIYIYVCICNIYICIYIYIHT
jgi:hypothetical protein